MCLAGFISCRDYPSPIVRKAEHGATEYGAKHSGFDDLGLADAFNVQKVLWLADALGLDDRHITAGGRHGGLDSPAFRAMNPHGKVPVRADGEQAVWESYTILRYLAARAGPTQPCRSAGSTRGWRPSSPTSCACSGGFYRQPPAQRDLTAIATARTACEARFALLDRELATRF
ncbi:glutathione S-transferase [Salinisphaera sp. SPP-AMP-43]|uniref:glutathione S-transferase N-terminal domain-containing protein n=1 Tax=Salinisphaera sp. SPP-AMP-43 TaxID=3121288 RepID=UPI003C6DDFB0